MTLLFLLVFTRSIVQVTFTQFLPLYLRTHRGFGLPAAGYALAAFMTGWSASTLDSAYFHELWLYGKSPMNRVNFESATFDRLLEQGSGTPDRARRIAFIKQADELIAREVPLIPLMYTRFVYLISPRVKGLELVPLSLGFGPFRSVEVTR